MVKLLSVPDSHGGEENPARINETQEWGLVAPDSECDAYGSWGLLTAATS